MNALVPLPATAAFKAAPAELFTAHDGRVEQVALIVNEALPWVVRRGGPLPVIVGHFATQEEADCAALAANHANERAPAALGEGRHERPC